MIIDCGLWDHMSLGARWQPLAGGHVLEHLLLLEHGVWPP